MHWYPCFPLNTTGGGRPNLPFGFSYSPPRPRLPVAPRSSSSGGRGPREGPQQRRPPSQPLLFPPLFGRDEAGRMVVSTTPDLPTFCTTLLSPGDPSASAQLPMAPGPISGLPWDEGRLCRAQTKFKMPLHPLWCEAMGLPVDAGGGKKKKKLMNSNRFEALCKMVTEGLEAAGADPLGLTTSGGDQDMATFLQRTPPLLQLYNVQNVSEVVALIDSAARNHTYRLTVDDQDFGRLQLKTMEDYVRVSGLLYLKGIEMSTWPIREETVRSYLVQGFPSFLGAAILKDELEEMGLPVRSVFPVQIGPVGRRLLNSFIATLWCPGDWSEDGLLRTRHVGGWRVTIMPYMYLEPPMCYNCCRFNHSAYFCAANQRCSQCGGEGHDQSICTAPTSARRCCNCGGDHCATDPKCPVSLKERQKQILKVVNWHSRYRGMYAYVIRTPPTEPGHRAQGRAKRGAPNREEDEGLALNDENFPALPAVESPGSPTDTEDGPWASVGPRSPRVGVTAQCPWKA